MEKDNDPEQDMEKLDLAWKISQAQKRVKISYCNCGKVDQSAAFPLSEFDLDIIKSFQQTALEGRRIEIVDLADIQGKEFCFEGINCKE